MIVTALLEESLKDQLSELRNKYFPPKINYIPAHVTLFHAAPLELQDIWTLPTGPVSIDLSVPVFLGKGFGVKVICPELEKWKATILKTSLKFTPQDKVLKHFHVTFQNKVTSETAKKDFAEFCKSWRPITSEVRGVETWIYQNGPWEHSKTFLF